MKLTILVVCALIGFIQAATLKPTREPNELEQLFFHYNRLTHNLLLKEIGRKHTNCYVESLTDKQMSQVHSDNGLKMLELSLLGKMSSASQVSMSAIAEEDSQWCNVGLHNRTITYFSL